MFMAAIDRKSPPFGETEDFGRGKYHEVLKSSEYPDVLFKVARTEWHPDFIPGKYPLNDRKAVKENLDLLKGSFQEFLPPTQIVVGYNEKSEENVYVLQDRIEGKDLRYLEYSQVI